MRRCSVQVGVTNLVILTLSFLKSVWLFDLIGELTFVFALMSVTSLIASIAYKSRPGIWLNATGLALAGTAIWIALRPVYHPQTIGTENLKIIQINLLKLNSDTKPSLALIRSENPDIVALYEVVPEHKPLLDALTEYPHRAKAPYRLGMDLMILSRHPLEQTKLNIPASLACQIRTKSRAITLFSAHPPIPQNPAGWRDRNRILLALAAEAKGTAGPRIIVADFNATPFSGVFRQIQEQSGLRSSAIGYFPTWPTLPLFALDHLLVSPEFQVIDKQRGPSVGSDHRPVITKLAL